MQGTSFKKNTNPFTRSRLTRSPTFATPVLTGGETGSVGEDVMTANLRSLGPGLRRPRAMGLGSFREDIVCIKVSLHLQIRLHSAGHKGGGLVRKDVVALEVSSLGFAHVRVALRGFVGEDVVAADFQSFGFRLGEGPKKHPNKRGSVGWGDEQTKHRCVQGGGERERERESVRILL